MAMMELDPLFLKALTLLRSKSRESADQLKALLDEVLGKKSKTDQQTSDRSDERSTESKRPSKEERVKKSVSMDDRRSTSKRPLDKQTSMPKPDTSKKPKLEVPKKPSSIRKPVIDEDDDEQDASDEDAVFETEKSSADVINISSDSDDLITSRGGGKEGSTQGLDMAGQTNMDDFALELGLACVVCKTMDVSAKNQLIECQECHSLYHQFCHKPPATDADANDPRLVWYCARCQRNMRKSVDKKPIRTSSSMSDLQSAGIQKGSGETALNLFKRSESKTPSVSSAGKSQPFTGLVNFAANVSGKSSASAKTSLVQSKPSTIIGKSNSIRVNMAPTPIRPIPTKSGGANTVPSRPGLARPLKPGSVGPGVSRPGMGSVGGPKTTSSLSSSRTIVSKFKSSSSSGSRSPSPQPPMMGGSKIKGGASKNLPQISQASAMKRLQQMKKKASSKR